MTLGGAVAALALKKEKTKKVILGGSLLAAVPDLDMFLFMSADDYSELIIHRSFSHAILPFLILSLILAWFNKKTGFFSRSSFKRVFLTAFLVLFTHALLDCLTTWGTQLFWPLDYRLATQTIYVIDPYYSITLLFGLAMLFIFSKKDWSQWLNLLTFSLSTAYLIFLLIYQQIFIQQIYTKEKFKNAYRVSTQPYYESPLKYRAVIEMQDSFYVSRQVFSLFDDSEQDYFTIPKNEHLKIEVEELIDLKPLISLTRGFLVYEKESHNIYRLTDLRYSPQNPGSEKYESIFTYYVINNKDGVEFKQNYRTRARLEKMVRRIFM